METSWLNVMRANRARGKRLARSFSCEFTAICTHYTHTHTKRENKKKGNEKKKGTGEGEKSTNLHATDVACITALAWQKLQKHMSIAVSQTRTKPSNHKTAPARNKQRYGKVLLSDSNANSEQ